MPVKIVQLLQDNGPYIVSLIKNTIGSFYKTNLDSTVQLLPNNGAAISHGGQNGPTPPHCESERT